MENIKFSCPAEIMSHKIWFFNNSLENQIQRYIGVGVINSLGMSEMDFRKALESYRPLDGEKNYLLVIGEKILSTEKLIDLLVYKGEKVRVCFPIEYVKDPFSFADDFYFAYDVEYGMLHHAMFGIQVAPEKINRRLLILREAICLLLQYGAELVDGRNKEPQPIIMAVTGSLAEWWGPSVDWWKKEEWMKEKLNKRPIYILYSEAFVRKPVFNLDIDLSAHSYAYALGVPTCKIVN